MKKKKTKVKKQKILSFPKKLNLEQYFSCPIWWADQPKYVNKLNKASDKYIKESQKNLKKTIDERNKKFGDKGDMGNVFHSTSLIGDPKFNDLLQYIDVAYKMEKISYDLVELCNVFVNLHM